MLRFAPSPTGLLHIGNVRVALINYLYAKKKNLSFFLRIDDTDQDRSKTEFEKSIIEDLEWLGIHYKKVIRQSERISKYKEIFDFLFSLRNHGGFHEHCIEKTFLYIKETFSVDHLEICGRFFRRGGIDINPIRSTQKKLFFENFREFNQ